MELRANPVSWWSQDYKISVNDVVVAELRRHWWREQSVFTLDGELYHLEREGSRGWWTLRDAEGDELAHALKPSAWRDSFEVHVDDRILTLERPSAWRRAFQLREGEAVLGELRQGSIWNNSAVVVLSDDFSLPVQIFLTQLMLFLWQREDAAVVAAGAG